jgi:hypothetical protein
MRLELLITVVPRGTQKYSEPVPEAPCDGAGTSARDVSVQGRSGTSCPL